jgi:hypothetical protein
MLIGKRITMDEKARKFWSLFPQRSFVNMFNIGGHLDILLELLSEQEIDALIQRNVYFVRTSRPASTLNIPKISVNGEQNLVNFDHMSFKELLPEECIAIILHEIGHLLNPQLEGMAAEFTADAFAAGKCDYGRWIISSLKKGVQRNWPGFDVTECNQRIQRLLNFNSEEE